MQLLSFFSTYDGKILTYLTLKINRYITFRQVCSMTTLKYNAFDRIIQLTTRTFEN